MNSVLFKEINIPPLYMAVKNENVKIVQLLLNNEKIDPNLMYVFDLNQLYSLIINNLNKILNFSNSIIFQYQK